MDDFLNKLAHSVGRNLRTAKRTFDRRIGKTEHPHLVPYRGFGNDARVMIMGRALRDPGLREATDKDTLWKNLIESYKRIETDELPGARILVTFKALTQEIVADEDGFFRATIELGTPPNPDAGFWHEVKLELMDPKPVDATPVLSAAQTLIPPRDAQFGVISDLDDTVIQTGATDVIRMVRATIFGNARTRIPFAGVAAFYAALQSGGTGTGFNPIFYVSSSPWNLYDVIEQFLALQRIPLGPTLLRDWGMSLDRIPLGHSAHKLTSIRQIMSMYTQQRFILIGDSGQEDPEIYREIVREYPGRILCCYIRNVTPIGRRGESLLEIAEEIAAAGSEMVIAEDTNAAARHAAAKGFITEESLPGIATEEKQVEELPR
ncbi:MAG TPA: phosphatase domain-containing protein [Longimicrobiales bacterium]